MSLKAAELFAGYGGLALAVEEVFGAETTWFSEFDAAPSRILAHHWPDVPNYGDVTQIDFNAVPQVDIISGGSPCQDLSAAGRRKGMTDGTRSNLWVQMREAIATIKPTYVVWENVRGAYSAEANSELEHCPGCMGNPTDRGTVLRALGRVLGDLSDLGYDCQWRGLRAADVGAPHGRFRVFVLATLRPADDPSSGGRNQAVERHGSGAQAYNGAGVPHESDCDPGGTGSQREATAVAADLRHERPGIARDGRIGSADGNIAPPYPSSPRRGEGQDSRTGGSDEGQRARGGQPERTGGERTSTNWGTYEPAIRRWESTLGRRAPAPTEPTGRNGGHRLSARFAEWMMGVSDGWIVDVPGISRNEALKAAGNGVVPQQAAAALRHMLNHTNERRSPDGTKGTIQSSA